MESLRFGERLQLPEEAELALCERTFQGRSKLASKDAPEHSDREEEGVARADPAPMIEGESARRCDTMDMRMVFHFLIPGVQHAEEADFGAEMLGITSDFDQCLSADTEQQTVDNLLVLECKGCQETGQGEHDVSVARREKFCLARLDPVLPGIGLALGAVPIAARVVRDGEISALGTLIQMPAESGRATALYSCQGLQMLAGEPLSAAFDELLPGCADDIGHLQRWPAHL